MRRGSLGRVVLGMAVLLDPHNEVVDPALDYLERHPKWRRMPERPALDLDAMCAQALGRLSRQVERSAREHLDAMRQAGDGRMPVRLILTPEGWRHG